jgi:hypothetical protein
VAVGVSSLTNSAAAVERGLTLAVALRQGRVSVRLGQSTCPMPYRVIACFEAMDIGRNAFMTGGDVMGSSFDAVGQPPAMETPAPTGVDGFSQDLVGGAGIGPDHQVDFHWRLAQGMLPLQERHLRSLKAFEIDGPLQSWVRERLEWTLQNAIGDNPNGVLHLCLKPGGALTIAVTPRSETPQLTADDLVTDDGRVERASIEGIVWVIRGTSAVASTDKPLVSAVSTVVRDLLITFKCDVSQHVLIADELLACGTELFVASDEYGIVPIFNHDGPMVQRLDECFKKLWEAS